jgi:hypothetical protein
MVPHLTARHYRRCAFTPEIDDVIRLMHTPEVAAFCMSPGASTRRRTIYRRAQRAAVQVFTDHPAKVQHYIADLIDDPSGPLTGRSRS